MTKKSPEFQFEVDSAQSLDAATVFETAGMFIGACVHGSTASTQFASYHVEANSARKWIILGKLACQVESNMGNKMKVAIS